MSLKSTLRWLANRPRRSNKARSATPARPRPKHLALERLEDRTLLDAGQWLVYMHNLPSTYTDVQKAAFEQLIHFYGMDGSNPQEIPIETVAHMGFDGVLLVQTNPDVEVDQLARQLSVLLGFDTVEDFSPDDPTDARHRYIELGPAFEGDGGGGDTSTPPPGAVGGGSSGGGGPFIGPSTVSPLSGFDGINHTNSFCGCSPPDSDGAVGVNSFLHHANTSIALYGKATGSLLPGTSVVSDATFFASVRRGTDNFSDPVSAYDEYTGRYVTGILEFSGSGTGPNGFFDLAVSKTSTPATLTSADWDFFQYNTNDGVGGFDFSDYPKLGFNADGLVVSFNMFRGGSTYDHVSVLAIANDGSSPGIQIVPGGFSNFTLGPASMHTAAPGDPMWFVQDGHGAGGGSSVQVVREDNPFSSTPTFTPFTLSVPSYGNAPNPRQPGGSLGGSTTLGTRFYFSSLQTVGGVTHLVAADAVGNGTGVSVRWYDFDVTGGTASIIQQGAVNPNPATTDTYFPDAEINAAGQIGLIYSESGNSTSGEFMSMYVTGRNPGDPAGALQTPVRVKTSTVNLNALGRAGDYSKTTIDPVDGSFWGINEYASGTTSPNWAEWIEHFSITGASTAPAVTGVSPSSGPAAGGTTVTISGTGFTGASAVHFGALTASFTVVSDTTITATAPAESAGTVDVTVTTAGGTSPTGSADHYTYVAAPAVSGVSPSSGPTGGGNTVTITGTRFTGASAVHFGAVSASFTVVSDTTITATAPAESAGTVDVTVTTVGGTSSTGAADHYTYVATPAVSGLSPSIGPAAGGTLVTITGSGFTGATAVRFGTVAAGFTVVSDTTITATAPAESPGTVDVIVTTPSGTSATGPADQYTFVAPGAPAVTSVSPSSGPAAGGTTVTISGSGFTGATEVDFGGVAAGFTVVSDTTITATAPAGAPGTVDVIVAAPGGTSPTGAADRYTYVAAPAVTGVAPSSGPTAGGNAVTITGSGFTGATSVLFGTVAATGFTVVNDTTIVATAPAEAPGTVDVTVTTVGGTSATGAADQYTFVAATVGVLNVTSTTPDGTYGVGANIVITVQFSGPVFVLDTPTLALNSGGTAVYTSGSGTDTLTFTYTVGDGDSSLHLDYTSASALAGTVQDGGGNPVDLTLPAPGSPGSLGANTNIVIDTGSPQVVHYFVLFGSQRYDLVGSTRMDLPWSAITGIQVVFNETITSGDAHSLTGLTATGFSGLGTTTLTWTFATLVDARYATSLLGSGPDALRDAAGHGLNAGRGFLENFAVLIGDVNDDGIVSGPDYVAAFIASQPGNYSLFADFNGDGVVDHSDLAIIQQNFGRRLP